ncbi:hypothetical protein [Clostridium pasteurianum]|uniref:Uncharacterized protein n=1 Tax=Clostridium pasteurianum BC1 TaxID=86416 RepID=R4K7E3_CLOPA|nr:hypothetical protein [Clostridium pasteurianum]AGK97626.1 hypothetical protein Clopa_2788 [Clostridium pasteurianum BC1]
MRSLLTQDLFPLTRIVKKMNIKNDIKAIAKDLSGLSDEEKLKVKDSLNIDLMMLFIENIGSAEKEIYKLLSNLSGKTEKEIAEQKLIETIDMLKEIFNDDQFDDFFGVAVKSLH